MPADRILVNGRIVTMDPAATTVEAVALSGERIVATGTAAGLEPLSGPGTETVDLEGRVVLPGFIDAHVHIDCTATHTKLAGSCHIPPVDYVAVNQAADCREGILAWVAAEARNTPKGQWIIGQGRFTLITDGNSPTRRELDAAAPDHPVTIRYSAHAQILNGRALAVSGITGQAPSQAELDAVSPGGRVIREPSSGEPTGVIYECNDWVFRMRNPWPYEALKGAILETCREAARFGVTGIHEFTSWSDSARIYQDLYREGTLPLRVQLCPCVWGMYRTLDMDGLVRLGLRTGFGDEWIKFGSAKIFTDVEGRDEDGVGREWPRIDQRTLNELVAAAHRAGIRVMMHATSRDGQTMAIDAVEAALADTPRADHRHRIEHFAGDYWPEGLARLKTLGIIPVPTPYSSLGWYGDGWLETAGPGDKAVPYQTLLEMGFMPPGNSDSMGTEPEALNPWWSIWCAVGRKTRSGRTICPEEGLSVIDAIRLYTTFSAFAGFEERIKGSIEPGKLADLIVLSDDPFEVPVDALKDIRVTTTIVGGRTVHSEAAR
jgi:hypothetical protein